MTTPTKPQSLFKIAGACLALWWSYARDKEILMENGQKYHPKLSSRSRLFDRIGRLVLFHPEEMRCSGNFFDVPGDRHLLFSAQSEMWDRKAQWNVRDNHTRVVLRELISKKAAKAGIVVVVVGALIAPFAVESMTPIHPLSGVFASAHLPAFLMHF